MKNNVIKFLTLIVLIVGPVICSLAQPMPGNDPGVNDPTLQCSNPIQVPVGNGYWLLLALAFAYGAYKIWQIRQAEKTV